MAKPGHGSGAEHVADQLLGSASLEPRGAGQHLGANFDLNGKPRVTSQFRATIAHDGNGCRFFFLSVLQGGDGVRSAAAGGEPDNDILSPRLLASAARGRAASPPAMTN
jgi:hypothetical protein